MSAKYRTWEYHSKRLRDRESPRLYKENWLNRMNQYRTEDEMTARAKTIRPCMWLMRKWYRHHEGVRGLKFTNTGEILRMRR
jgi:hypothetical protein